MPEGNLRERVICLVVTDNFVEAADIEQALASTLSVDVVHVRNAQDAVSHLGESTEFPSIAVVSSEPDKSALERCLDTLDKPGTRLVLVDVVPSVATRFDAPVLTRPFTDKALRSALSATA